MAVTTKNISMRNIAKQICDKIIEYAEKTIHNGVTNKDEDSCTLIPSTIHS